MNAPWHFPVFVAVSFLFFLGVLRFVLLDRERPPARSTLLWITTAVVVGGMCFAKLGATNGFPAWVYYGLPAGLTWLLPPLALRMSRRELVRYVPAAVLVAPVIHALFSLLLGWKEYMPFLPIPSLRELFG